MFPVLAATVLTLFSSTAFEEADPSVKWAADWTVQASASLGQLRLKQTELPLEAASDDVSQLLIAGYEQIQAADYAAAADTYRRALSLLNAQAEVSSENLGEALLGLGSAYVGLGSFERALPELEAAQRLFENLSVENDPAFDPARPAESDYADILLDLYHTLGVVHHELANFATALGYYQQTLAAVTEDARQFLPLEFWLYQLHNISGIETRLGQYAEAEATLQRALVLSEQSGQIESEEGDQADRLALKGSIIFSLGRVKELQQVYDEAIAHYQSAIDLFHQGNESGREIRTLNNLGIVHLKQGDLAAAKAAFDQGFAQLAVQDDAAERSLLLDSLGSWHQASGDSQTAWALYLQALQLSRQTADKPAQIETLLNLGQLMESQDQIDLAIFFYKQAIAQIETIRKDLQQLSEDVQQRYTLTIEDFYRNLADLLLRQNREAEALQILELLKLQEVNAYLHSHQDEGETAEAGLNTDAEAALLSVLNERIDALPVETSLAEFIAQPTAVALVRSPNEMANEEAGDISEELGDLPFDGQAIASLQAALSTQPLRTAVLYPLILKDRLEILLITPEGTLERFTTSVSEDELRTVVGELQKALKNEALDPNMAARQLYDLLIRPLDQTLAANRVENIVYLPDSVLRYVPLAALHDGERWLAQKYQSYNITAATVGDLTSRTSSPLSVMAGAFADSTLTHQVQVGASSFSYSGLSGAKQEIDNLIERMPNTTALLDQDFTPDSTLGAVGDRQIVHLATHAQFMPGQPEDSFILFGNGHTVNMRDIQQWRLPGVELVVLSACETASSAGEDGKEILGLGFQMQETGAAAVLASLWAVDDEATAALMTQFYQALSEGKTKAQALQYAQTKLASNETYRDPYYWAAFVLIGNGL
ncbi:MAG: CHAT domain-containing protein [Phormidesmis sp.]